MKPDQDHNIKGDNFTYVNVIYDLRILMYSKLNFISHIDAIIKSLLQGGD